MNLGVAALIVRLDLQAKMKSTFSPCRAAIDAACVRSLGQWKSNGQTPTQWFTCYKRIAAMLLGAEMATRVLQEKNLAGVRDDLTQLVNSSQLGEALFSKALKSAAVSDVYDLVNKAVADILSGPITVDTINENSNKLAQGRKALGREPSATHDAKEFFVTYRGLKLAVTVRSPLNMWFYAVQAAVRAAGVEARHQVLKPLWSEQCFVERGRPYFPHVVEPEAVEDAKRAREALEQWLDTKSATGAAIATLLKQKSAMLRQLDKGAVVEEALFTSLQGEHALRRVQEAVLRCFPTMEEYKTVEEVSQALANLDDTQVDVLLRRW